MLLNYSTTQSPSKSILAIQEKLSESNVDQILITYENGVPIALSFSKKIGMLTYRFKLPCRYMEIHKLLQDNAYPSRYRHKNHALAVAWRILQDWVDVQMALVDAHLVTLEEVFLPYQLTQDEVTIYERFQQNLITVHE